MTKLTLGTFCFRTVIVSSIATKRTKIKAFCVHGFKPIRKRLSNFFSQKYKSQSLYHFKVSFSCKIDPQLNPEATLRTSAEYVQQLQQWLAQAMDSTARHQYELGVAAQKWLS